MIVCLFVLYFGTYVLGQKYEGCYKSSALDPDLPSHVLDRASTPAECIKECRSRYFMFAGLMNGQQCYCGSNFGRNGPSSGCNLPCARDPDNFCGAQEAISIYATGQKGPSPPRRIQTNHIAPDSLQITWQPPDISNGNITSYTLKGIALETHASTILPPVESQVQGGASNSTILQGLQPGTKYNISLTANNLQGSSDPVYASDWTEIDPPDKPITPQIISQNSETVTVLLSEGSSENGPVSAYQLIVVQPGIIAPTGANVSYTNYEKSTDQGLGYYITGEFESQEFHKYRRFMVGDGKMIGGYHNAPLKRESLPRIGLVVVSRFQRQTLYAYSDLTNDFKQLGRNNTHSMDSTAIVLWVAITLLGILLVASVLVYFMLRQRHEKIRMKKLPEQQELTLQGPVYEVDNMGYIPEDVPERANHYQELKSKVWTMPKEALTIEETLIRRGRFGTVHKGSVVKDNVTYQVAVHTIADRVLRASEKRNMLRELDVCIKASTAKNLAGLVGTCETADTLYVVLELPTQTLKNRLLSARSGETFPANQILPIGAAVASALQHLENYKIVHTHLCARSVGLRHDWAPKVMGHGISKYALEDTKYARWTAIECFGNKKRHQPGVVWAFGVLLWEMLSMGGTPYANLSFDSEVEEALEQGIRLPQLQDIPDPLYEVMLSCWNAEIQERPTFNELMRLDTLSICPISSITEPYIPELELNQVH